MQSQMHILDYSQSYFHACSELYLNVFNGAPWNDDWTLENVKRRLLSIIGMPTFKGYLGLQQDKLVSVCLGHVTIWWKNDVYFVDEMFVPASAQRMGYGSQLLKFISEDLKTNGIQGITLLTGRKLYSKDFYMKNGLSVSDDIVFMKT